LHILHPRIPFPPAGGEFVAVDALEFNAVVMQGKRADVADAGDWFRRVGWSLRAVEGVRLHRADGSCWARLAGNMQYLRIPIVLAIRL
jgi:hypothetical protein